MEKEDYLFTYLYYSSKYLYQNVVFVSCILICEFIPLLGSAIQSSIYLYRFINSDSTKMFKIPIFVNFYDNLSLIPQIQKLSKCTKTNNPSVQQCNLSFFPIMIIIVIIIIIIVIVAILSKRILATVTKNDERYRCESGFNILLSIIFNFYDYLFFRVGALYILFILSNFLVNSVHHSISYLILPVSIFMMVIYCSFSYYYFKSIFIFIKLCFHYPFDQTSTKYDRCLLLLKFVLSIKRNLEYQMTNPGEFNYLLAFISIIEIVIHFAFLLVHIIKFICNQDFVIFQINNSLNCVRLFMLNYAVFSIVFFFIFYNDDDIFLCVISHASLLFMSGISIKMFVTFKKVKIYNGGVVNQMFYLIDKCPLLSVDGGSIEQIPPCNIEIIVDFYTNIHNAHLNQCQSPRSQCKLCCVLEKNGPVFNYKFIQELFLALYSKVIPPEDCNDWMYYSLTFITQIMTSNNNYFIFNYSISRALFTLGQINKTISANALVFYKLKIDKLQQYTSKVHLVYSVKKQTDKINKILDEVYQALFVRVPNPFNLVTSSLKLNNLWKEINKLINKVENRNLYQSLLIKFVLEMLFNKKVKMGDNMFDITIYEDILSDNYINDKHLALAYNLRNHHIVILSSGKEFIRYKNSRFDEIFVAGLAQEAIKRFKESVSSVVTNAHDFTGILFQFPIKDIENSKYIMSFKYKYMVLPMIQLKKCIIFGIYQIDRENLIQTELNPKKNEEIFLNYSYAMKKDLLVPAELIKDLISNRFTINIQQLFSKIGTSPISFRFNFKKYCSLIRILLKRLKSMQSIQSEEEQKRYETAYNAIEYIEKGNYKKKEIILRSTYEIKQEKSDNKITFYIFDKDRQISSLYKNDLMNCNLDVTTFIQLDCNTLGSANITTYSNLGNSTSAIENSIYSKHGNKKKNLMKLSAELLEELKEKMQQSRNFRLFTIFILCFNIFLILLTIFLLIMLITKNQQLNSMFNFFVLWSKVMRLFFNSTLNIFVNICIGEYNNTVCYNNFTDYERQFVVDNDLPSYFSLKKFYFDELMIKADILRKDLIQLNMLIYDLKEQQIIEVIEEEFRFRYLSISGNNILVKEETYKFMDALSIYFNLINILLENDDYSTKPIYILNIQGNNIEDIKIDNINMDAPLTQGQIAGYNVILNFQLYISSFFALNEIIQELLLDNVRNCYSIMIIFFVLLLFLHLVLLFFSLFFSKFFQKILDVQVREINTKMEPPDKRAELQKKIITLRRLSLFYEEEPNKLIDSLLSHEKKKIHKEKTTNTPQEEVSINHFTSKRKKIKIFYNSTYYKKILANSLRVLYFIFIVYSLFSIIIFALLIASLMNYSLLIKVLSQNAALDTSLCSLTGLLQITILTNQTEYELAQYLNRIPDDDHEGFVLQLITRSFSALITLDKERDFPLVPKLRDVNCLTIYSIIEDDVLIQTNNEFPEFNYLSIVPLVCNSYEFMNQKDVKILINELIYRSNIILKNIQYTYEYLYNINNSYELFDMYILLIVLFEPFRNYETITLFLESINSVTTKNNLIAYTYLCCNIIIEFIIFILIRKYVIQKYNLIHKSMNRIKSCINS